MEAKRIAAFGEVMMRLQTPGCELLTQAGSLAYSFSGTGVNVMSALSRFGYSTSLISRLPDNPLGDAAAASLRKLGVMQDRLLRGGQYIGMYFLEKGFGSRPSRVTYSNRQESSFNTAPADAYHYERIAADIDVLHLCGISLAMNDGVRLHMRKLAEAVKERGGTIVFDCNYRPALWGEGGYGAAKPHYEKLLQLADMVMMNERDAIHILGMQAEATEREEQLKELMPGVAGRYGISVIAGTHRTVNADQTHSLRGFLYKEQDFAFSPKRTFMVYDRIGAGDAYTSGIIHGELQGFAAERTVGFAAAAAVLAHTIAGDTPMSLERDIVRAMADTASDVER
ncbi:sugar kinase [Paenibacillus glycanilyticus]|uniref:sugar kinase n=1 Tax=Paenibacillus glycanilyticus TaxID=126569 RepID=UPI00203D10DB|nr:sugar kinase [Paenibacillus glycanilyticus]MCM3630796.1 sugar kinase [Paenibacillus glycanilyticus]